MRTWAILTLLVNILASGTWGAESRRIHAGVLGGLSFLGPSGGGLSFGLRGGYRLLPALMAGGFFYSNGIGFQSNSGLNSVSASTWNFSYGGDIFLDISAGFSAGIKLGLMTVNPNVSATDSINTVQFGASNTFFLLGPAVAYEYPLGMFSVGGEVSYFHTFADAPKMVNLLGVVKLVF